MHVLVTGASGHIGKAVTASLLSRGHTVLALIRSVSSEKLYRARFPNEQTVQIASGTTAELDKLARFAATADAVIHLANITDPSISRDQAAAMDENIIRALARGLATAASTHKAFAIASGTGFTLPEDTSKAGQGINRLRLESDIPTGEGFNGIAVRISPTAHGKDDAGFVAQFISAARKNGVSLYVSEGENRWSAVHVLDVAELFVLAIESSPNATVLHGTGETEIKFKSLAEAIGQGVGVPVKSETDEIVLQSHFGRLAALVGLDIPVSNERTLSSTGWVPRHVGLIEGLTEDAYF
ncbi:UDP-galactose 4-epimerase [Naematelia encephala]|uniref:UDP-galactose 4-epimerase n=1 Tax=Naematelia encephala TaxID=71784 RepID=A0A1Y2B272_9TREE|nr:UDP-galactose 4-epimerase [Naematelia encephala]